MGTRELQPPAEQFINLFIHKTGLGLRHMPMCPFGRTPKAGRSVFGYNILPFKRDPVKTRHSLFVGSHDRTAAPAIRVPLRRNSSSARNASSASANSDRSTHSASVISLEYSWVFISPLTDATLASGARLRRFRDVATQRLCHRLRSSFFPPRPACGTRLCRSRGIHCGTASIRWGSR